LKHFEGRVRVKIRVRVRVSVSVKVREEGSGRDFRKTENYIGKNEARVGERETRSEGEEK
jgi:hypothetical protein